MISPDAPIAGMRRIVVMQGEARVSSRAEDVLSTVLGSCVAVCLYDPIARVGGLNHYLLAGDERGEDAGSLRYGVHLMEVLIKSMLAQGARRDRLRARVFGGASMHPGFGDIGLLNVKFAHRFLGKERIAITGEDTGGVVARRVEMCAGEGLVRCRRIAAAAVAGGAIGSLRAVEAGFFGSRGIM